MPRLTGRLTARTAAAVLIIGGLGVAACGPGAASTGQPTESAAPSAVLPSTPALLTGGPDAQPTEFHDTELEALLPDEIAGQPMYKSTMTGPEMIDPGPGGDKVRAALTQFGKTPADLSVAFGAAANVSVSAYRIKGIDADEALLSFRFFLDLGSAVTLRDVFVGGKAVKKVVKGATTGYFYTYEDVIFTIQPPPEGNDAAVADAISKLP
jgi:hypothetical protein